MESSRHDISPGSIWRRVKLGTDATYEVLAVDDEHVEVEVRQAPGLERGMRIRLRLAAVAAMQRLEP